MGNLKFLSSTSFLIQAGERLPPSCRAAPVPGTPPLGKISTFLLLFLFGEILLWCMKAISLLKVRCPKVFLMYVQTDSIPFF